MNEYLKWEWDYRYQERLGILCGSVDPTPEQIEIAKSEADQTVYELDLDRAQDKIIQRDFRLSLEASE